MSSDHRAFSHEYSSVSSEMASLRQSILQDLNQANADITSLVARGGSLHCTKMSANVTVLMQLIRADLHAPNDVILDNFETCMNGYISGVNHFDQAI